MTEHKPPTMTFQVREAVTVIVQPSPEENASKPQKEANHANGSESDADSRQARKR